MPLAMLEAMEPRVFLHGDAVTGSVIDDGSHDDDTDMAAVVVSDSNADTTTDDDQTLAAADATLPHQNDHVKQMEHLATFELVPHEEVTHRAVQSGLWSRPETWANGLIPIDDAHVLITADMVVTVDRQESARLHTIRVDGLLRFDATKTAGLTVDTLVVDVHGSLEIGTAQNPIQGDQNVRILFTSNGAIDTDWDPLLLSRGLISHGRTSIYGQEKTAHLMLGQGPRAGDLTLQFALAPQNWKIGDRILVPGVNKPSDVLYHGEPPRDEDEILQIASISADGRSITLDRALTYDHQTPRGDLQLPIANLDRNIVFESENKTDPTRAGHVMFMHNPNVVVAYADFRHIGRNNRTIPTTDPQLDENGKLIPETGLNPRGRYGVHFHRTGIDAAAPLVLGAVVEKNPGWGFVNHDSHVIFQDNITYDAAGAGFVSEIGNETGKFIRNLAVRSRGLPGYAVGGSDKGAENGLGSMGHGFWIQSPGVELIDNIAAGHAQEGIFVHGFSLVDPGRDEATRFDLDHVIPGATVPRYNVRGNTILIEKAPFLRMTGNKVFASGTGIGVRWHRRPDTAESGVAGDVIENFEIWNVTFAGLQIGYTAGVTFRNGTIIGDVNDPVPLHHMEVNDPEFRANLVNGKGIIANANSRDLRYENLDIEGFTIGIQALRSGDTVIDNVTLRNAINLRVVTPQATTEFGEEGRRVWATNVINLPLSAEALNGAQQWDVYLLKQLNRIGVAGGFMPEQELLAFTDQDEIYYNGKRLYFYDQAPGRIPFPTDQAPPFMHGDLSAFESYRSDSRFSESFSTDYSVYVDKTNQQLADGYNLSFGGGLTPASATDGAAQNIFGWVQEGVSMPEPPKPFRVVIENVQPGQIWLAGQTEKVIRWQSSGFSRSTQWSVVLQTEDGREKWIGDSLYSEYPELFGEFELVSEDPDDAYGTHTWSFTWSQVGSSASFHPTDLPGGDYTLLIGPRKGQLVGFVPSLTLLTGDTVAPTAQLQATTVTTSGPTQTLTVTYEDNVEIDASTIDDTDLRVTGPNGFDQLAQLLDVHSEGGPVVATYRIDAPHGVWSGADNGTYVVWMQDRQVTDSSGNFVPGGELGQFQVNVADSDAPGITVTHAADLTTTEAGGTAQFQVVLDSRPTANVTLGIASSDTGEGIVSVPSLTFTPDNWHQPQAVTVTGIDDAEQDGDVTYTIQIGSAVSADPQYNGMDADDLTLTNIEDDTVDAAGLVAHWAFDETAGTTADDSSPFGKNNAGTLQGNATWSASGAIGGALRLDGAGDYVHVADSTDINIGKVDKRTISAWFMVDDKTIASRKQVIYEEGATSRGLNIYVHDGRLYVGGWNMARGQSDWAGTFLNTDQIQSGRWHHVTLVLDGSDTVQDGALSAYLDGVQFGSGAGSALWSHKGDIGIGQANNDTKFHDGDFVDEGHGLAGLIDDVRVYNRVLGDSEIWTLAGAAR